MTARIDVELVGGELDGRQGSVEWTCPCGSASCVPILIEVEHDGPAGSTVYVRTGPPRERASGGVVWRYELTGGAGHDGDR